MGLTTLLDTFRLLALTNKNQNWLSFISPPCGQKIQRSNPNWPPPLKNFLEFEDFLILHKSI